MNVRVNLIYYKC